MHQIHHHGTYLYDTDFANFLADEFDRSGSDKTSHHCYHEPYSHLLAGRKVSSFLEIGLFLKENDPATDLHSWARIFPDAQIYGADRKKHLLFNDGRISTFYVDQDSKESLEQLKQSLPTKIDFVLDDASHMFDKSVRTFESLYDVVADGGIYAIEDILIRRYSDSDWEQNIEQLVDYFSGTDLNYEVFTTSSIRRCVDSIVLAVYK